MTKFFSVPTKICGEVSEFWTPVAACPPNWGYGEWLIRLCF